MINIVWDWKTDHEGQTGWLQRRQPDFNISSEDFIFAHDALEHFPACQGHVADECIALGALLRGRGEGGGLSDCPARIIGNELERFFAIHTDDVTPPPRLLTPFRSDRSSTEETIQIALDHAIKVSGWSPMKGEDTDAKLRPKLAAWLRIGYEMAERRYRGTNPGRIAGLFWRVREGCKKYLKYGEMGETLHLAVDPISLSHKFRHESKYQ